MHSLCGGFAFSSGQRVCGMPRSWTLTARSTLVSLEFGAVSMRFSAADAMFAWICVCSEGELVFPNRRSGLVR